MGKKNKPRKDNTIYNKLPTKVSQKEFNLYIKPFLSKGSRGPKPKVSYYKIFNYILYVLHTGVQWRRLQTYRNELHWSNVYRHHNRWSKDKSYERLFRHSLAVLRDNGKIDLSILHCDGSNTVAKKGAIKLAIRDTNISEARKS